jgi:hypothetical protein
MKRPAPTPKAESLVGQIVTINSNPGAWENCGEDRSPSRVSPNHSARAYRWWRGLRCAFLVVAGCASCGGRTRTSESADPTPPKDADSAKCVPVDAISVPISAPPCSVHAQSVFGGAAGWSLAAGNGWVHFGNSDGFWERRAGGQPVLIMPTDEYEPVAIVETDDAVYWSASGIHRMEAGRLPFVTLADRVTEGLSVDSEHVYFATWAELPTVLYRIRLDGTELEPLKVYPDQALLRKLVADDRYIYAGNSQTIGDRPLLKIAKDGSGETELATVNVMSAIALAGNVLYWTESGEMSQSALRCVNTGGGEPVERFHFEGLVFDIAVQGQFLYVTQHSLINSAYDGHLQRMALTGEGLCELASYDGSGVKLAATPESVYLITANDAAFPRTGQLFEAPH